MAKSGSCLTARTIIRGLGCRWNSVLRWSDSSGVELPVGRTLLGLKLGLIGPLRAAFTGSWSGSSAWHRRELLAWPCRVRTGLSSGALRQATALFLHALGAAVAQRPASTEFGCAQLMRTLELLLMSLRTWQLMRRRSLPRGVASGSAAWCLRG